MSKYFFSPWTFGLSLIVFPLHVCRLALESIRRENERLKKILFETFDARPVHQGSRQKLLALLEKQDRNLESQLSQLQEYVQKQTELYNQAENALKDHRVVHGSVDLLHQETMFTEAKLHQLEDKKHKSLVDRGEAEHSSRRIRNSIDSLRRERLLFEEVYRKKQRELVTIGHDVSLVIHECTDRIESIQKSKAFLKQINEAHRKEASMWSLAWRDEIIRMNEFTSREIDAQKRRCSNKRNRVLSMLGPDKSTRETQSEVGHNTIPAKVNTSFHSDVNSDIYRNNIDMVAMHIGSRGPDHHINIVNEFESMKSSCVLQQKNQRYKTENLHDASVMENDGTGLEDPTDTELATTEASCVSKNRKERLCKTIQMLVNIARGVEDEQNDLSSDIDDVPSEKQMLCYASMLEVWVHMVVRFHGIQRMNHPNVETL